MGRSHLLLVGLCAVGLWAQSVCAQAPTFEWAAQAGGTASDSACRVAVDSEGGVLVVGQFYVEATLGTRVLTTTNGNGSFFVGKYSPEGQLLWARAADGEGTAYDPRLGLDAAGNVYLTGLFHGTLCLGPFNLRAPWDRDFVFITKIDREGRVLWAKWADGVDRDSGHVSRVDAAGHVYITGAFPRGGRFGHHELLGRGGSDVFVAKYDSDGNVSWVRQAGGEGYDAGQDLQVDPEENVYVTGAFSGTADFGGTNLTSGAGQDVFLAKYDRTGRLLWVVGGGGEFDDEYDRDTGSHIAVDGTGHVYLAGMFRDRAQIGEVTLRSVDSEDLFLARFDSAGQVLWAANIAGFGAELCRDLRIDSGGNAYLAGFFEGTIDFGTNSLTSLSGNDVFLARYDATGRAAWAIQMQSEGANSSDSHVGLDALDQLYLVADCVGEVTLGGEVLLAPSSPSFLVAKLDTAGHLLWARLADDDGSGLVRHADAVIDPAGNTHVIGVFEGEASFDTRSFLTQGCQDVFVAKVSSGVAIPRIVVQPGSVTAHAGMTARFTVTAAGTQPLAFQWFRDDVAVADSERVIGATSSTLILRLLEAGDGGRFTVTVTNASGQATSAAAVLTVDPQLLAPAILGQPASQEALRGDAVRLEVIVTGSEPLSYQWQRDGTNLPGAASATLILAHLQPDLAGNYTVVVSNAAGSATSATAVLTVLPFVNLSEALDDYGLVWNTDRYGPWYGQWRIARDGVDAAQCFVAIENTAWLETEVTGPGIITFSWKISVGEDASLSFSMDNDYWARASISGETDWEKRSLFVPEGTHLLRWYTSRSEGTDGGLNAAWVDEVSFTTNAPAPPSIVAPLRDQTVAEGDDLLLEVEVEGTDAMEYWWQHNGISVGGGSRMGMVCSGVTPAQEGDYSVMIQNQWGTATSTVARVTVGPMVVGWEWSREVSSTAEIEGLCVAADAAGNAYIGGQFSGRLELGTNVLWADNNFDLFLAKFDRAGRILWAQQAGSLSDDAALELGLDPSGNLVVYGFADGSEARFGSITLIYNNDEDEDERGFFARYTPDGEALSAAVAPSCDRWSSRGWVLDRNGNIYISRHFWGSATVGGTRLITRGECDAFVAKYTPGFNLAWVRQVGDLDYEFINDLAADGLGQVYLAGTFGRALTLGATVLKGSEADQNLFLAKLDSEGSVVWARAGEPNHYPIYNLTVDEADNLLVRGGFFGTTVVGTNVLDSQHASAYFLAKYDPADNVLWARAGVGGGGYYRNDTRMGIDSAGNIYFKGDFAGALSLDGKFLLGGQYPSAFVAKHDPTGTLLWLRRISDGSQGAEPNAFVIGPDGAVMALGRLSWYARMYVGRLGVPRPCLQIEPAEPGGGSGSWHLALSKLAGRCPVVVEMSTDLVHWEPIYTNTVPCHAFECAEPIWPAAPARFYRAVVP